MLLSPIEFGGMESLEADELVPIGAALVAENCTLDDDTIRPRNGYRAATAAQVTTGGVQGLWRFRPSPASARSVSAIAGKIHSITDPSTELLSDGATALAGTPFGATAHISAAQLGRYLYLATDESGVAWNRMDSSFALVGLGSLAQAAQPVPTLSSLAITRFFALAAPTLSNCTNSVQFTDENRITPSAQGATAIFNTGADLDWTAYGWVMITCSPPTSSTGGGSAVIAIATGAGSFETLGSISDTTGDDTPVCIFLNLNGLTPATRAAVRRIQFTFNSGNNSDFLCNGFMPIPAAPTGGPQVYNVTFYNSTTKQESPLSPDLTVAWTLQTPTFPTLHNVPGHQNGFQDQGQMLANPDSIPPERMYNKSAGTAYPTANDCANIPIFAGNIPALDQYPACDFLRLWRVTSTGRRLVKAVAIVAAQTTYSVTDDQGDATLAHDLYRPQGTPPRATTITARAQRLIAAYENRIYISSFIPTSASNDPYPQFPDIPVDDSDGWSFDIAPSNVEQVQWIGNGDALYILSNEAAYVMTNLDPNSIPYKVFERGVLGRRAACWAEERLFYAGWDGVYAIANRVLVDEISQPIRRMYREWLAPDSTTVVAYQGRKLYVICGLKYLRYDFVKGRWTRGTLSHTMLHAASWRDPSGSYPFLWFLASDGNVYRWQPAAVVGSANAATTDAGTALPSWIYATGFEFTPQKGQVRKLYLDMSGAAVQISVHRSMEDRDGKVREYRQFAHESPQWGDYTSYQFRLRLVGLGGAQVRRLLWERIPISGEGAGNP